MKKGIIAIYLAAFFVNAGAWDDLNPDAAVAQAKYVHPYDCHLKTLWGDGDECGHIGYVWAPYDDEYWGYADPNNPTRTYLYQVYEFPKPENYSNGSLRWRIWGWSGLNVSVWHWNNAAEDWDCIDEYYDADSSMGCQYYGPVPASWFNVQPNPESAYCCYFLVMVPESDNGHVIVADVCDIQPYITP